MFSFRYLWYFIAFSVVTLTIVCFITFNVLEKTQGSIRFFRIWKPDRSRVLQDSLNKSNGLIRRHKNFHWNAVPTHWITEINRRKSHALQECQKMINSSTSLKSRLTAPFANGVFSFLHTYVDVKNKIFFCGIPKVAIMNWRLVFLRLAGKLDQSQTLYDIQQQSQTFYRGIDNFRSFDAEDKEMILRDFLKVIFVRHPLSRILSAYRMMVDGAGVLSDLRKRLEKERNNDKNIPLGDFIQSITSDFVGVAGTPIRVGNGNDHWAQYYQLCDPCTVKYDVIGYLEKEEDASNFLKLIGANFPFPSLSMVNDSAARHSVHGDTRHIMKKSYASVHEKYLDQLRDVCKIDAQIFEYDLKEIE